MIEEFKRKSARIVKAQGTTNAIEGAESCLETYIPPWSPSVKRYAFTVRDMLIGLKKESGC